jgi:hypothetical protein
MRILIATKQEIAGFQRKLAWFSFHGDDLYFEIAGMLDGSHTSYHRDGKLFRTSPATQCRATLFGKYLPLSHFQGLYKLGMGMLLKSSRSDDPKLTNKDRKGQVYEVDIEQFPSDTLNLVAELLEPNRFDLISDETMRSPMDALIIEVTTSRPWVLITLLGHDHNLLIAPYNGEFQGVTLRHFNSRYTASPPGGKISYEAYK